MPETSANGTTTHHEMVFSRFSYTGSLTCLLAELGFLRNDYLHDHSGHCLYARLECAQAVTWS